MATPSSYHQFIEVLLHGGDKESLGQWQMRVYEFIAETPLETLSSLNETTIQVCAQRWSTLMRSANCAESLYAAYISCRIQRHASILLGTGSSLGSCPPACPTLRAWIEKCHAIFRGAQSIETVKNTLIRILKLSYDEKSRGLANADGAIALSGAVLTVSKLTYAGDWVKDTSPYARKIAQKFHGMPSDVQIASIHVLAALDPKAWLSDAMAILSAVFQHLVVDSGSVDSPRHPDSKAAEVLLQGADQCMTLITVDQSTHTFASLFRDLYDFILEQCQPSRTATPTRISSTYQALRFVDALQEMEDKGPSVVTTVFLRAVAGAGVPNWWPLNMSTPGTPETCSGLTACVHHDELLRQKLCDQVSILVVTSACSDGRHLPHLSLELLRQRLVQGKPISCQSSCAYKPFIARPSVPIQSQNQNITSHNWRDHLRQCLGTSNRQTGEIVEHLIAMVCRDLEDRCNDVETPLRAAQAETSRLHECIQQLESKIATGTTKNSELREALRHEGEARIQSSSFSDRLEESLEALRQQLAEAHRENEHATSEMALAMERHQRELQEINEQSTEELETARRQCSNKISELEAHVSSQAQARSALQSETAWLKEQTELARKELVATHERGLADVRQQHQQQVDDLNQRLRQRQESAAIATAEIDRLISESHEKDCAITSLGQQCDRSKEGISELRTELATANDKASALSTELVETKNANDTLSKDLDSNNEQLQKKTNRIDELEASEARWKQRCAAVEKALVEARQREEGIQALLGGGAPGLVPRRSALAAIRTSIPGFETQATTAPRLPAGSFISDDDEDYYEIMKL
ncbi:uncharacterized protein HMPREF1541_00612 [Cyphellophora europaea CBS 101466]|uniref:Uncharacterized protein n=1 Tax=Cyphellophora europaea (strain CBS 101466) TaxID=1220924 RepID=W2SEI6_CYPE1|nr:uncharacterized protein HMPREF1541_00612 [Cyphellophora europaea CBS 101466]ETN46428.1 hypothetical protein HMPREF1541_00612 [Cyphellophora europaea CBS 101466]